MYSHIDLYISESLYIQIKIMLGRIKYDRAYKNNTHTKILRAQMVQKKGTITSIKSRVALKDHFCVCVTYVLLTVYILHFISDPNFLRLPVPVCIPAIRRLRSLPCYTPTTSHPLFRIPDFVPSRLSRRVPLDLATPGREQFHHRSIRQLRFLPNARPFVARAAEEQAVRPHYC